MVQGSLTFSQAPSIQWQKNIGGLFSDDAYSILQTADGGYIVAGSSASNDGDISGNHGGNDFYVLKLSSTGTITWQKSYGGSQTDIAKSIEQTTDGGYIIAGYTDSQDGDVTGYHPGFQTGGPTFDFWVIKISGTGILQWQKCLGGTLGDAASSIKQTTDGGYIVAGTTDSNDGDVHGYHPSPIFYFTTDFWVVKLDSGGGIQWDKAYGGILYEVANSVQQTNDGGYIVAGYTDSPDGLDIQGSHVTFSGPVYPDFWVTKLSPTGIMQWQKCLGGTSTEVGYSIIQTADDGYVVAGIAASNDGDVSGIHYPLDFWVVKLNNGGTIQWQKCFGGSYSETAREVQQTSDGGYIIAGGTDSQDDDVTGLHGTEDFWLLKISASGILQWQKCLGGTLFEQAYSVKQTTDAGYIVAGVSTSADGDLTGNNGPNDMWVVKLGPPPCIASIKISATDTLFCAGKSVTFNSTIINGGTNPVYKWLVNGIVAGTNTSSFTTTALKNNDSVVCMLTSNAPCLNQNIILSDTIIVQVNNVAIPLVTTQASSLTICKNTPVYFSAISTNGGIKPSFQWTKNGNNTGTDSSIYIDSMLNNGDAVACVLTSDNACAVPSTSYSNIVVVAVNPIVAPSILIAESENNICPGTLVSFKAISINDGSVPVYQWKKNNVNVGTNSPAYSDPYLVNGDSITCMVNSNAICVSSPIAKSNSIIIKVQSTSKIQLGRDRLVCENDVLLLQASGGFTSYLWQDGSTDSVLLVTRPGLYYVQANDLCGNTSSDTLMVGLFPRPSGFLPADTTICSDVVFLLQPGISFKNYLWNTGSTSASIDVSFPGNYWLQATDINNCKGYDTILISARECLQSFFIPNAFTPNNDGKNDLFKPVLSGNVQEYLFIIYNRWGQKIYESTDALKGWDGNYNGQSQNTNVFVWTCKYKFTGGAFKTEHGTVTLIK